MLEKNTDSSTIREIEFNWERVKKKATSKREELISNNPNVSRRPVNTSSQLTNRPIGSTSTTDTIMDPYHNIEIEANKLSAEKSIPIPGASMNTQSHIDIQNDPYIDNESIHDESNGTLPSDVLGTSKSDVLALAAAQGRGDISTEERSYLPACNEGESLGPDRNAVELIKAIKNKETTGKELTLDERRLVVRSMKELGQTQDAIADMLTVSRRTVVSDYKALRQEQALMIASTETHEIAGEVYDIAKTCIRRALQAGSYKTVSTVMRDMIEVLQSLGVVYRAPKTSMQASLHGQFPGSNNGYQKYMDTIGDDKNKVIDVLDCMFNAIDNDSL